jgi:hypothetical protein
MAGADKLEPGATKKDVQDLKRRHKQLTIGGLSKTLMR